MKILIIGASGFLGRTISFQLKKSGFQVLGTYCNHAKDDFVQVDILDTQKLLDLLTDYRPDAVIWTLMNHELEEEIAEKIIPPLCEKIGDTRFIFVSTSVAYEQNMTEDVKPLIRDSHMYHHYYFNGKIKAEQRIRMLKNYCIVRPGSIYGVNPYGEMDGRSKVLKNNIDSGLEYVRANNIIFSIVEVNELANAIIELITNPYIGIMNISEEKPISHYEFNKALCRKYGWDEGVVVPNEAEENIYFFDNSLRKKILKSVISTI